MPNWCENILTIEDCSPELDQYLQDNGFSFEKMIPTPPELLDGDGWYDWRVANWGTKWDVGGEGLEAELINETTVQLSFDSAWNPPLYFYQHLEENHGFTVTASWFEGGMGFAGEFYDGEMQHYEWSNLEEAKEVIPEHIEDQYGIIDELEAWAEENE